MRRILLTAPACLGEYRHQKVEVDTLGVQLDGHGSPFNSAFGIACKACGGESHRVTGFRWRDESWPAKTEAISLSPLTTRCGQCGREAVVFDSERHGYDPVVNAMTPTPRSQGSRDVICCEKCGGSESRLWTRFEFSPSIPNFAGFVDRPQFTGREQDLFSWFTLVGECAACGERSSLAHFETA